jgi:ferredoxin
MKTTWHMEIDRIKCDGHGLCAELLPERIHLDDWGYPIIEVKPIDERLEAHARKAVSHCPVRALRLVRQEVGK